MDSLGCVQSKNAIIIGKNESHGGIYRLLEVLYGTFPVFSSPVDPTYRHPEAPGGAQKIFGEGDYRCLTIGTLGCIETHGVRCPYVQRFPYVVMHDDGSPTPSIFFYC